MFHPHFAMVFHGFPRFAARNMSVQSQPMAEPAPRRRWAGARRHRRRRRGRCGGWRWQWRDRGVLAEESISGRS